MHLFVGNRASQYSGVTPNRNNRFSKANMHARPLILFMPSQHHRRYHSTDNSNVLQQQQLWLLVKCIVKLMHCFHSSYHFLQHGLAYVQAPKFREKFHPLTVEIHVARR